MICFLILIFLIGIDTAGGSNMLTTLLGLGDTKLNPDILTNVMSVAGIVQGMLLMLAPTLSLKMYGTDDTSLYLRVHAEFVGAAVLTCGVCCLCLFVLHLDAMKTLGFASLVWAAEHVKVLVNEYPTKLGYSRNGHIVWLLFSIAIIYACFVSASYTKQLFVAGDGLFALNTILVIINPSTNSKIYGFKEMKFSDDQKDWLRAFGYENLAMCVFSLSLVNGVEAHAALGLMSMVVVAHCAHSLVGNWHLGMLGTFLMYSWMIFHASCSANFVSNEVAYLMASVIIAVTAMKIPSVPSNFEFPQVESEKLATK